MTKISLTDELKKTILKQYHPHILIDLWSLEEQETERFVDILSFEKKSITDANPLIQINLNEEDSADHFIIHNNEDILFEEDVSEWTNETRLISPSELNPDNFNNLQDNDFITFSLYDAEDDLIIEKNYKINICDNQFFFNEDVILWSPVNLKIIEQDIQGLLQQADDSGKMLSFYQKHVSGTYDNIIFTPEDDLETIIPFEYYRGVFYLKLPRFYTRISMHICAKYFDASDDVALFTTEDIIDTIDSGKGATWISTNAMSRSEGKVDILGDSGVGIYLVDIPNELKHANSIEIDVFYKYLDDSNIKTKIGILDLNNRDYEINLDTREERFLCQKTLLSNNQNLPNSTNQIISISRDPLLEDEDILDENTFIFSDANESTEFFSLEDNEHKKDIIYESVIKYINDNIYTEEYNPRKNDVVDRKAELRTDGEYNYAVGIWTKD